ncbi:hypothetical protein BO78DRAFT_421798 [Aspergillus sclerotiicarbonarius CBS 121057]|uniref:NAD(P)-binding protein n=1 Tax=Aspergillus sclerotiicarbonarius (strain CBS 121057 / IBT 28362) TaxID=1448318 RepID=A0A319E4T9_ASPSB|nr:hypothetical protein BO78DRAFT_421798 [Aspergillus sclerotiicarbonarius CBS 121057]
MESHSRLVSFSRANHNGSPPDDPDHRLLRQRHRIGPSADHHVLVTARAPSKIPSSLTTLTNVTALQLDVTDPESVAAAVRAVEQHGAGLNMWINNAGAGYTMPLLDVDLAQAQQVYETNVWGPLRLTRP